MKKKNGPKGSLASEDFSVEKILNNESPLLSIGDSNSYEEMMDLIEDIQARCFGQTEEGVRLAALELTKVRDRLAIMQTTYLFRS